MWIKYEKRLLRLIFGCGIFLFIHVLRKPPLKDWLIIFLLKSYIASILDNILVKKGYLKYPVNLFKFFDISVVFSYLIFPVSCVYFNQVTKGSNFLGILYKCLIFSFPSALIEHFLEKNTKLITYKRSWTSVHSFFSIASTFLIVRFLMGFITFASGKKSG